MDGTWVCSYQFVSLTSSPALHDVCLPPSDTFFSCRGAKKVFKLYQFCLSKSWFGTNAPLRLPASFLPSFLPLGTIVMNPNKTPLLEESSQLSHLESFRVEQWHHHCYHQLCDLSSVRTEETLSRLIKESGLRGVYSGVDILWSKLWYALTKLALYTTLSSHFEPTCFPGNNPVKQLLSSVSTSSLMVVCWWLQQLPISGNTDNNKWSVLKGGEKLQVASERWGVIEEQPCWCLVCTGFDRSLRGTIDRWSL